MLQDILKTLPGVLAGLIALGVFALNIVVVVLVFKIYKNTKPRDK